MLLLEVDVLQYRSMSKVYRLVKKNSQAHQRALESVKVKNESLIPVGSGHIFIPSVRSIDIGYNVSHAKNRTKRARISNMQSLRLTANGQNLQIKVSNRDLRTYRKLMAEAKPVEIAEN